MTNINQKRISDHQMTLNNSTNSSTKSTSLKSYGRYSRSSRQPINFSKQQGWTFWSLMFVILVILFFAYVGMQLVPIYAANGNVQNAMKLSLDDEDVDLNKINRAYIIRKMDGQLYLDGSHKLLNYKTDLKVRRSRKKFILETHYEREVPLFYNLSVVAKFDNVEERELKSSNQ